MKPRDTLKSTLQRLGCSLGIALGLSLPTLPSQANSYDPSNNNAPIVRWYRTYANGVPILSATITEQHIRNGYEGLDRNMQVVKRVPAYSVSIQARRKAALDQQNAQRMADRNLVQLYTSSLNATTQRDRLVRDLQGRQATLQKQLADLSSTHLKDVASAASYERRGQPVPHALSQQLLTQKEQIGLLKQNLLALQQQESNTVGQYNRAIQRMIYLEKNPQLLVAPALTRQ